MGNANVQDPSRYGYHCDVPLEDLDMPFVADVSEYCIGELRIPVRRFTLKEPDMSNANSIIEPRHLRRCGEAFNLLRTAQDAERLLSTLEESGQLDLSADPTLRNLRAAIAYAEEQS